MAMLRTSSQSVLEALRDRLVTLERSIPPSAEKALARHRELLEVVAAKLASWRPRWEPGGPAALEATVAELEALAERLEQLTASARGLRQEVGELKGRVQQLDTEVVGWIEVRCRDWGERLARIGAEVVRGEDVADERRRLEALEGELRQHFQALFWLGELREGMAAFREGIPRSAEELVADLVRALISEGVSDDWLRRGEEGRQRLGEIQAEEAKRPPELGIVARLLPLLRGWSQALDVRQTEVQDLDRRFRAVVVADWATLPLHLKLDAERLEEALRQRAEEQRRDGLSDLRRKMGELIGLCGQQPGLAQEVAALDGRKVSRPQNHQRWMRELTRALERLGAIASSHRGELEALFGERCAEIEQALLALRADPLSDAVSDGARAVEQELATLPELADVEAVVAALCRAGELLEQMRALRSQASTELACLRDRQQQLLEASAALRAATARLDPGTEALDTDDLDSVIDPAIDELAARGAGAASLALAFQAADRLESQLADRRQHFDERCRGRFDACAAAFRALSGNLLRLDPEAEILPLPSLPADCSPAETVAALLATATLLGDLDQQATAVETTLEPRQQKLVEQLARLAAAGLDPGDRERVERLVTELAASAPEDADRNERLRWLGSRLVAGEALVERREAAERASAERRQALERRLDACRDEGLDASYSRWWQRTAALVYGLPEPPSCSPDHLAQLDHVEILCARLELASQRLAAADFAAGLTTLRRQADGAEARSLLAEIEALDETAFPPLILRRRLRRILGGSGRRSDR